KWSSIQKCKKLSGDIETNACSRTSRVKNDHVEGEEEEEEWGLGLLYNLTTVVFNPTLVPSTKLLLSTEDAYGVGVGKGTSSMQFKGALEMQLAVQRQVHDQVEETMEQSRHLEYAVNFWYYKHGLLQMKVSSICIMLVCYSHCDVQSR
ncbi:hypothetical protein Tco_1355844, partial [Tanacetum coccineum]